MMFESRNSRKEADGMESTATIRGTATISLKTLDELRAKAKEAEQEKKRSEKFTKKLMDCYGFDAEEYDKYMNLVKKQKELYFRELIEIFSHNKKEYVRDLLDKYAGFSTQDVLLLLMCEMQLDNKTMARIMGLTLETLKKRKTRMRIKMRTASPVTL